MPWDTWACLQEEGAAYTITGEDVAGTLPGARGDELEGHLGAGSEQRASLALFAPRAVRPLE